MIDLPTWQALKSSAIGRRHSGDLNGAIEDLTKAIGIARTSPQLAERTAIMLNYLTDIYLDCSALAEAEAAIREAVELSRPRFPGLLADNLWMLAEVQRQKGEYAEALASAEESQRSYRQADHSYGAAQAEKLIERIKSHVDPLPE